MKSAVGGMSMTLITSQPHSSSDLPLNSDTTMRPLPESLPSAPPAQWLPAKHQPQMHEQMMHQTSCQLGWITLEQSAAAACRTLACLNPTAHKAKYRAESFTHLHRAPAGTCVHAHPHGSGCLQSPCFGAQAGSAQGSGTAECSWCHLH